MILKNKKLIITVCGRPEIYDTESFKYQNRAVEEKPRVKFMTFALLGQASSDCGVQREQHILNTGSRAHS